MFDHIMLNGLNYVSVPEDYGSNARPGEMQREMKNLATSEIGSKHSRAKMPISN